MPGKKRRRPALPEPEEQLDLHGFTAREAEERTAAFIERARRYRLRTVLVITGKGLHSPQGPVLKDTVESMLRLMREEGTIAAYGWEKGRREESGGLLVQLP